jgi:hypothetical protein
MTNITRTERGWPGHFCAAKLCTFRRNTLLQKGEIAIIVSTVGDMIVKDETITIGHNRYYETMVFRGAEIEIGYIDSDVTKNIDTKSEWRVNHAEITADQEANDMHERIVAEIVGRIEAGEFSNDSN